MRLLLGFIAIGLVAQQPDHKSQVIIDGDGRVTGIIASSAQQSGVIVRSDDGQLSTPLNYTQLVPAPGSNGAGSGDVQSVANPAFKVEELSAAEKSEINAARAAVDAANAKLNLAMDKAKMARGEYPQQGYSGIVTADCGVGRTVNVEIKGDYALITTSWYSKCLGFNGIMGGAR